MYAKVERSGVETASAASAAAAAASEGRITGRELALLCFYVLHSAIFFLIGWAYGYLEHVDAHHRTNGIGAIESCAHATEVFMPRAQCALVGDA